LSSRRISEWQAEVLRAVREGSGEWDARKIDLIVDYRIGPGSSTMLDELEELARMGFVERDDTRGGSGGRWTILPAGVQELGDAV
jgi:hypothetical protein